MLGELDKSFRIRFPMERYSQTANKTKEAAETSLGRIRRSIEGALEKEKQCVEKESVNQYIRDASIRMSLNLPIKPVKVLHKEKPQNQGHHRDYKLPSLQHGDRSPTKRPDQPGAQHKLNMENSAKQSGAHSPRASQTNTRLPPIIIDTGQGEVVGKRKRKKKVDHDSKEHKRKSPKPVMTKNRLESDSSCEEELSVVMCGRSPNIKDGGKDGGKEMFVSKHGRFKSK